MKKQRKHTGRGSHYRALAEGYAALNAPNRDGIFQRTADYFDDNDAPLDLVVDADKVKEVGRKDDD